MNSQLAVILTNGSLDGGNGSQSPKRSGAVLHMHKDPLDKTLFCPSGTLQSCALKQASCAISIKSNGRAPGVGGTSQPAPQEMGKPSRLNLPITVRTGRPVLCSQPIRIKVVIPGLCKRPITNSATGSVVASVLVDPPGCLRVPDVEPRGLSPPRPEAMETGPDTVSAEPATSAENKTEEPGVRGTRQGLESFHERELEERDEKGERERDQRGEGERDERGEGERDERGEGERDERGEGERDTAEERRDKADTVAPATPLVRPADSQREQGVGGGGEGDQVPPSFQNIPHLSSGAGGAAEKRGGAEEEQEEEQEEEEQVEVLDLSLPKKRESSAREWRCGRFLGLGGSEGSLIMEVDEIEGDGDRDIVEEDDGEDEPALGTDGADSPASPSSFSTSLSSSLSLAERHSESLLLIDDQGIPYTLSPDGHKVPQIDSSKLDPHPSDRLLVRSGSAEVGEEGSSHPAALGVAHAGPSGSPRAPPANVPSRDVEPSKNREPPKTVEPPMEVLDTGARAVVPQPSGAAVPPPTIQILANPSSGAPFLLLPPGHQLSSAPLALSLSLPQGLAGCSAPLFLLLSSVRSASGQTISASTPIAVINAATGQLSQIAAPSPSVSLPLSSPAPVTTPGSAPSHPIIRLTPNNPPLILSGASDGANPPTATPSLSVPPSSSAPAVAVSVSVAPALSSAQPHAKPDASEPNAASADTLTPAEEARSEDPQPRSASSPPSPRPPTPRPTSDPSGRSSPRAAGQSPAPESELTSCDTTAESFPLDDHLYFSPGGAAAPGSPPVGPPGASGQAGDPEALSPPSSPSSLGPRRVLYCQLCPRIFYYLSDLERHSITHSQVKPHVCQQCGKSFKRSSHLQRHKHIHTGQRNFVCPICGKRFREAGELQRHQRVHTGEKPYQCQLCHTRFAERNTLRRHTRRKHPYHQVAMEMLSERRGGGGGGGGGGGEEEESAEWYSSTMSNFGNSDSEMDT